MNSGQAVPERRALWRRPGSWIALALLLLPVACTSLLVQDLTEVGEARHLQIVDMASGRMMQNEAVVKLPSRVDSDPQTGLRQISFEIPIDHYMQAPELPAPGQRVPPGRALLVSQAIEGMDIYLNGVWVAGLPRTNQEVRYRWNRPLVVPLARRLLRPGGANTVVIEFSSQDSRSLLPPLYIGGVASANLVFELTAFIGSSMANASNLLCLLAGLFLLGAGVVSREDGRAFTLAGALTTVWAVLFWLVLLPYVPVEWLAVRDWLQYACLGAIVALLTLFVFAFIGERMPDRVRRAMWTAVLAVPLIFPFGGPGLRGWLAQYWLPLLMLFYLYATVRLARHAVRTRRRSAFLLLALSILTQVFALHDHNVVAQLVPLQVPGPGWSLSHVLAAPLLLSHLTMPLLLLVMAQNLLAQLGSYVERIRKANDVLQDTLAQRERELLVSYQRQRDMESESAAQSERDRIYRELHDGIGSKLVTTLFSVRDRDINHGQLEHRLLDALKDLRETISVTQPQEERSIQDVLFTYATNLDEALSSDTFHVEIDIPDDRDVVLLGDAARGLLRIVEETVANTVKYAGATRLRLSLRLDERNLLRLDIDDNGQGDGLAEAMKRSAPMLSGGRGLAGMRTRARQLGGRYRFVRTRQGAHTRLRLPLGPAALDPPQAPTGVGGLSPMNPMDPMDARVPMHPISPMGTWSSLSSERSSEAFVPVDLGPSTETRDTSYRSQSAPLASSLS
jgi:signal transduction histidine kinase